ncbi:MAG: hypothetical protein IPK93_02705 [Solirubrobacterales bacterium]|nr:hypothetical protein [Solirubrobacterales bacterium]
MNDSELPEIASEIFPIEDVRECMRSGSLQRDGHAWTDPEVDFDLVTSKRGAIEAGAPASIKWIYFRSPPSTWEGLCGREGWLLIDPETCFQFDFSMTVMN